MIFFVRNNSSYAHLRHTRDKSWILVDAHDAKTYMVEANLRNGQNVKLIHKSLYAGVEFSRRIWTTFESIWLTSPVDTVHENERAYGAEVNIKKCSKCWDIYLSISRLKSSCR